MINYISDDSTNIKSLAKLRHSDELANIIKEVSSRASYPASQSDGPVESHPEYKLIVDANNISADIDNDLSKLDSRFVSYMFNLKMLC